MVKELAPPTLTQTIEQAPLPPVQSESGGVSWGTGIGIAAIVVILAAAFAKYKCKCKK